MNHAPAPQHPAPPGDTDRLRRAHERDPASVRLLKALSGAAGFLDHCPHRACRRAKACTWHWPSCYARDEAGFKAVLHPFAWALGLSAGALPSDDTETSRINADLRLGLMLLQAARLEGMLVLPREGGSPEAIHALMRDIRTIVVEDAEKSLPPDTITGAAPVDDTPPDGQFRAYPRRKARCPRSASSPASPTITPSS
ncbi:hypothetical protein [Terrihabitans sp. B22-R8]|uniref:hypothetical protein n=1 Tax=Terrihabitans sp. B22-R8 TaxID=3425128 RepID=UPI00403CC98A